MAIEDSGSAVPGTEMVASNGSFKSNMAGAEPESDASQGYYDPDDILPVQQVEPVRFFCRIISCIAAAVVDSLKLVLLRGSTAC